ncbi:MAG: hypothetical protein CMQ51_05545 [Gammaproteobacteria bacterium]|nr:hypothetical protein [Gammaproteobacteria bacterium]|tara:strand:- start:507 stop:881 length:375 start_codon:yes stop_codon:yes gene_type:complete
MFKSIKNFFSKKSPVQEESIEVEEHSGEDEIEYRRDPVIQLAEEDVQPIMELLGQNKMIKDSIGNLRLQYLTTEDAYRDKINQNNARIEEILSALRTTYSVDPDVDYELSFPEEEGGLPSFRKL